MIFATVGAQMPFDRMIHALDAWAAAHPHVEVFAQVGDTPNTPKHIPHASSLTPEAFIEKVRAADLIVAHSGMGSILAALEHERPILVMPRRADLRETRSDHQFATARRFAAAGRVMVALDERELVERLDQLVAGGCDGRSVAKSIGPYASPELIVALREFIVGERPDAARSQARRMPSSDGGSE